MNILKLLLSKTDQLFLNCTKNFNNIDNGLIFLLFHSVFKNKKELDLNHIDPNWGFTIDEYRIIFEKLLSCGYEFISHHNLISKNFLKDNKKYIFLHFDDGYYNNVNILPLLKEYKINSHFFVVADNIDNNEKF